MKIRADKLIAHYQDGSQNQKGKIKRVELVYPAGLPCEYAWEEETQRLTVKQPQKSARLFGIVYGKADEG